ncbi:MAG: transglycosylase domain-containing protein [Bacillota bacterium]
MKVFKIVIMGILVACLVVLGFFSAYFFSVYNRGKEIDINFENNLDKFVFLEFFDGENNIAEFGGMDFCESGEIKSHTFNAFIAKEDRRFLSHSGVDFRGILRAGIANLKSGNTVQGGSTITQQLAKNLLLSSEKKLSRKITEVALARKIEENYTKEEILTMYLNVIYFGENTFGITDASMLYFGKKPCELTISESAMLAGILPSPENFSPIKSIDIAKEKRDIVLLLMKNENYITEMEYQNALKEEITLNITKSEGENYDYLNHAMKEASEILGVSERELAGLDYKIFTYMDANKQSEIKKLGDEITETDGVLLAIDNQTRGVLGVFESRHDMIFERRSPASLIKPLLVYAPALEENIIFEECVLDDKKTDFEGYCPRNYNDVYYGEVTAKTALAKSLNVPSVKILDSLSVETATRYARMLDLPLEKSDTGLAVALGGLSHGFSPIEISAGYASVADGGEFAKTAFVREIVSSSGEIIYSREVEKQKVFGDDTAYILTDMLKECTRVGTGKKLGEVSPFIASKTGTNGDKNGNFDALACAYSPLETFFCWLGNADFSRVSSSIKGSTLPIDNAVKYFSSCGEISDFEKPESVVTLSYDKNEYLENGKLLLSTDDTPAKYVGKTLISKRFCPILKSLKYSFPKVVGASIVQSGEYLEIEFLSQEFAKYEIKNKVTGEIDSEILGTGKNISVVLPANGDYAQFEITAFNKETNKKGETHIFEKLYLKKNFLPSEKGLTGEDMPKSDAEILEFFS